MNPHNEITGSLLLRCRALTFHCETLSFFFSYLNGDGDDDDDNDEGDDEDDDELLWIQETIMKK